MRFPGQFVVASPFDQKFVYMSASVIPGIFNSVDKLFLFTVSLYGWRRFVSLSGQGSIGSRSRPEQVRIEDVMDLHRIG